MHGKFVDVALQGNFAAVDTKLNLVAEKLNEIKNTRASSPPLPYDDPRAPSRANSQRATDRSPTLLRATCQGATTHAENNAWGVCVSTDDVAGWLARWLAEWLAADRAERRIPSAASPSVSGVLRCVT